MKFQAICNLEKITPSSAENASYRIKRSHLNQKIDKGYQVGEVFDCQYISPNGDLWLKDKKGTVVFVPAGEAQCFECID